MTLYLVMTNPERPRIVTSYVNVEQATQHVLDHPECYLTTVDVMVWYDALLWREVKIHEPA